MGATMLAIVSTRQLTPQATLLPNIIDIEWAWAWTSKTCITTSDAHMHGNNIKTNSKHVEGEACSSPDPYPALLIYYNVWAMQHPRNTGTWDSHLVLCLQVRGVEHCELGSYIDAMLALFPPPPSHTPIPSSSLPFGNEITE